MAVLEVSEEGKKTQKVNNFYYWDAPSSVSLKEGQIQIRAGAYPNQLLDFIISYCPVYIKEGASIPNE